MNTIDQLRKLAIDIESLNRRLTGTRGAIAALTASDIPIVDAGDFYRATEVEAALQEEAAITELTNGTTLRPIALSIAAAGGVITASLSSNVGNTIIFKFSDGLVDVDVTAPMTVALTAGTDIAPVMNYLYVLKTDPTTLVANITGFPALELSAVGRVVCQSAATLQADGPLKQHTWSEDVANDACKGHLAHINSWIREQWATWLNGIAPTFSGTGTATIGYSSTAGQVRQLHKSTFPLFADPADVYAVNDPDTAYRKITNIADLLKDSAGVVLKNRTYGLVFWGAVSDDGQSKIFCNLPSGAEIGATNARQDKHKYINYSIPTEFRGVGFLIYRLIIKNNNDNTWTLYTGGTGDDLRGQYPATSAGSTTAIGVNFPDGVAGFNWFSAADITKIASLDLSAITPGNNRVLSLPDRNVNIGAPEGTHILSTGEGGATKFLREDGDNSCSWQPAPGGAPEGTAILSTGEGGGNKFLREDGDDSCSWQVPPSGAPAELMMAETFDGLVLGAVDGQGVYPRAGPFVSTIAGTGTSNVAVKAGLDYMLSCASGAPWAANIATWKITFDADSFISSGIFRYKVRTSDVTKNGQCLRFYCGGAVKWLITMGSASNMRFRWNTGVYQNIIAIANNTWYDVDLHWNSSAQSITIWIDGTYRYYVQIGTGERAPYISAIEMGAYSDSLTLDIDDLEIVNFGAYPSEI